MAKLRRWLICITIMGDVLQAGGFGIAIYSILRYRRIFLERKICIVCIKLPGLNAQRLGGLGRYLLPNEGCRQLWR